MINMKKFLQWKKKILERGTKKILIPLQQYIKNTIQYVSNVDIDFIFIYLVVFLFIQAMWWQELMFAIGVAYIYKKVFKDILIIRSLNRK